MLFIVSCNNNEENGTKENNKLEDFASMHYNNFEKQEDNVRYVPFFEVEKGDTISKGIFRDKPFFSDDVTVLYSSENDTLFRGEGGSSGSGFIYNLMTSVRCDNTAPATMNHNGIIYTKIPVDLNEGAGGKYIYLYYTKTGEQGQWPLGFLMIHLNCCCPILSPTNLYEKQGESFAGGWTDLNEGAGGYYIYLEGMRQDKIKFLYNRDMVIRNVLVISSTTKITSYPSWVLLDDDLNKGAGGKWIYLLYQ